MYNDIFMEFIIATFKMLQVVLSRTKDGPSPELGQRSPITSKQVAVMSERFHHLSRKKIVF